MAGVDGVAGGVVDDRRFAFSFCGLAPLLLVISLAQQLFLLQPESLGTEVVFGGVLTELACCVGVKSWGSGMGWKRRAGASM